MLEHFPNHRIRRLMTPFGFCTASINYMASISLVNEWGLLQRAMGLTEKGMKQLFDYAKSEKGGVTWKTIPQLKARKVQLRSISPLTKMVMITTLSSMLSFKKVMLRYYSDGTTFSSPDGCEADSDLRNWHDRVNEITPLEDLPPLNYPNMVDVFSTFMYLVSGGHNHVGSVAAELEDPCHQPWAWREHDYPACGTPRTFFTQAVIMALTSLQQPKVTEDFTHLFEDAETKAAWLEMTHKMNQLSETVINEIVIRLIG